SGLHSHNRYHHIMKPHHRICHNRHPSPTRRTSYLNAVTFNDQTETFQASGTGSVLDLHAIATITNGTYYNTHLDINALAGGTVNLRSLQLLTPLTRKDLI